MGTLIKKQNGRGYLSIKELTPDEVKLIENRQYRIYVLRSGLPLSKTYTHVILPYYDPNADTYNKQRVHTIYNAITGKDFGVRG